jgi:hypothetical protein
LTNFFIDKMMSCSSQDSYVLALWETTEHHLDQIVPSIEEISPTKCKVPTAQEIQTFYALSATTPGNIAARQQFIEKDMAAHDCERNALDDICKTGFRRKMDDLKKNGGPAGK